MSKLVQRILGHIFLTIPFIGIIVFMFIFFGFEGPKIVAMATITGLLICGSISIGIELIHKSKEN